MMIPADVAPLEARQFDLLLKRSGADPRSFKLRKLGYLGVPIARADGGMAGTLCHFDLQSHPVEDDEFLLLEWVAKLLPAFLDQ